eukprot:TRINITY_DN3394_c0_g1_i3.p1 TRINITY_DN3394_c0_g1~~TRINITY_DN3394_c0_g1_i3.p1  ORF type:complete len:269 (-),score=54.28 TRINITY_DN3394_c0_g1_i3:67-873(-)
MQSTTNASVVSLFVIPRDVIILILSFLPLKNVAVVSTVNKSMKAMTESEDLWKRLLERYYEDRGVKLPSKPSNETWRDYYKSMIHYRVFIEGGDEIKINRHIAETQAMRKDQVVYGRFHASGIHKYVLRIEKMSNIGIGVGSKELVGEYGTDEERFHMSTGCSVLYSTGYWYGTKQKKHVYGQCRTLHQRDEITVYFDVEKGRVKYFYGDEILANCKTNHGSDIEKGLRIGIVLGSFSIVSIIDYQPIGVFPTQKKPTNVYANPFLPA